MSLCAVAGILLMGVLLFSLYDTMKTMRLNERQRIGTLQLVEELRSTSRQLTSYARTRVGIGDLQAEESYKELLEMRSGLRARPRNVLVNPGHAVSLSEIINEYKMTAEERTLFREVLFSSDILARREREAMQMAEQAEAHVAKPGDRSHPALLKALEMLFDRSYQDEINGIQRRLAELGNNLVNRMGADEDVLLNRMLLLTIMLCVLVLLTGTSLVVLGYFGHLSSNRRGGTSRLYGYIILSLIVSLGVPIGLVYSDARTLLVDTLEKRQASIAREVGRELNLRIGVTRELALIVAARPAVRGYLRVSEAQGVAGPPSDELADMLHSVPLGYTPMDQLLLLNNKGAVVLSSRATPQALTSVRLSSEQLDLLKTGRSFTIMLHFPLGVREAAVVVPVFEEATGRRKFEGAVAAVLDRRNSFQLWEDRLVTDERMNIFILDHDGRVVLSSRGADRQDKLALDETAARLIMNGASGMQYYTDARHVERVGYFQPLTDLGWTVAVTSVASITESSLHGVLMRAVVFGCMSILTAVLLFTLLMQRMTRSLQRAQKRTDALMRTVGMFTWEVDLPNNRFTYSSEWRRFLRMPGLCADGEQSLTEHYGTIHPDDVLMIRNLLTAKTAAPYFEFEARHLSFDGQWLWVKVMVSVDERDASGMPCNLSGIGYEITAQKIVEQSEASLKKLAVELHSTHERLENIVQVANMFTFDYDVVAGVFRHNAEWRRVWRHPQPHEAGCESIQVVVDRIHPDFREQFKDLFHTTTAGKTFIIDFLVRTFDEQWRWHRHQGKIEVCDAEGNAEHVIGVGFDITAAKLAEQSETEYKEHLEALVALRTTELEESRNQAQAASEAKTSFLSTVSHEIRTPMNAIVGFAHIFERDNLTDRQKGQLEKIRLSAGTLLGIINDVLDISKIEAGRLEIEQHPFRLRSLLDTVLSIVEFAAAGKQLPVHVHVSDDVPDGLMGDAKRISQILLNLMNNAVKFTQEGHVGLEVTLHERDEQVAVLAFAVEDTGIGVTEAQMERLFKPFMQADCSVSRRFGGTGLGLAISRQLVELMGGSIGVRSEFGKGSTFSFTLRMDVLPEATELSEHDSQLLQMSASQREAERESLRGVRVLVVEDNDINQEIARALLEEYGLVVDMAANGLEALEKVQQTRYACIFMDMQMPVMDGLQASVEIRAMGAPGLSVLGEAGAWLAEVPIVAMTANAMAEDRQRCLNVGMNDHLGKPIDPALLLECLLRWLPTNRTS